MYTIEPRTLARMSAKAFFVLYAVMLTATAGYSQDEQDYTKYVTEWRELHYSVPHAVDLITYANDPANRATGLAQLKHLAMRGSYFAAEQLAYGYLTGAHGLPVDHALSQRYYEMAVRQESGLALFEYGLLLLSGRQFDANPERAQSLLLRAAQLGLPVARVFQIERLEAAGDGASLAMADAWREIMGVEMHSADGYVEHEDIRASVLGFGYGLLAEYYSSGVLVETDPALADGYLERVPDKLRSDVAGQVGSNYMTPRDIRSDHARARAVFESAADTLNGWSVNNFAWLLSTSPDANVRDGQRAVAIMEALLASETREYAWVDTLAAAYAEIGEFEKAVELQDEALSGFEEEPDNGHEALQRRNSYAEERAWRE